MAKGGEEEEEDGEESSLVQASRLCRLLPTDATRRAGERDQRNAEGGGEEDQGELEGSRDWRTELGQAAGEARPQRWRTVWTTRLRAR